ncbi:helicase [Microbacterium sp. USTB-Y]|uniref:helicase n=1 Tax=Microbacterium sp. USTB-Y TaxID=2823692 RepID=UPI00203EC57C|nr:helicase [Microbacterium sp. USTB-Y]
MAGSALAVGGIAVAAALGIGAAAVGGAGATSQRVAAAADAAALAAADVLSGAVAVDSDPCALAARVAEAHGAALEDCHIAGLEVVVRVGTAYAGLPAAAGARAGPPSPSTGRR